jgi:flagellar biosynthetic protein FliO
VNSWISNLMKKLKPSQIPQWLWGLILLGIILAGTLLVQQLFISERADASEQAPLGSASLVLDWILKLAFFLSLLFVGIYFARRWQRGGSGVISRRVQILESRHLSPKQAVHLIKADGRTFLIGATDQSLTLISEIQADHTTNGNPDQSQISFADELQRTSASLPGSYDVHRERGDKGPGRADPE